MRLAHSCPLKLSLKVNIINRGAKSLCLEKDCFGGEQQPDRCSACRNARSAVAFSIGSIFGQSEKNAQMYILLLIYCRGVCGFLTRYISACSMVWNKRTGWGKKSHWICESVTCSCCSPRNHCQRVTEVTNPCEHV